MKALRFSCAVACCGLATGAAFGQAGSVKGDAVNATCPISGKAIDGETFVVVEGKNVGFCCGGCDDAFVAWDAAKQAKFVNASMREAAGEQASQPANGLVDVKAWGEAYSLGTCPVSGNALGSMGDPIVMSYEGREVRFCCGGCIDGFEADQAGYWAKIDAAMVKDQGRYYPVATCLVSGEALVEDGEDIARNVVIGNRMFRLCCKRCERKVRADPATFAAKLDKLTADAQRAAYPLETCVVSGGKLGSMGDPVEMVVAGRLVRLCCENCVPKVKANPLAHLAKIDAAWQAKGKFLASKHGAHDAGHDAHGEHDDGHDHDGHGG